MRWCSGGRTHLQRRRGEGLPVAVLRDGSEEGADQALRPRSMRRSGSPTHLSPRCDSAPTSRGLCRSSVFRTSRSTARCTPRRRRHFERQKSECGSSRKTEPWRFSSSAAAVAAEELTPELATKRQHAWSVVVVSLPCGGVTWHRGAGSVRNAFRVSVLGSLRFPVRVLFVEPGEGGSHRALPPWLSLDPPMAGLG